MIYTTDHGKNNIEHGEEKDAEDRSSAAFDRTGNPDEGEREGSDRKNAVDHHVGNVGADQREHEEQIAKRNQSAEGSRGPDQNEVYRGTLQKVGDHSEKEHNAHEVRAHMTDIRAQNRNKFFHIVFYSFFLISRESPVGKTKNRTLFSKVRFRFVNSKIIQQ